MEATLLGAREVEGFSNVPAFSVLPEGWFLFHFTWSTGGTFTVWRLGVGVGGGVQGGW